MGGGGPAAPNGWTRHSHRLMIMVRVVLCAPVTMVSRHRGTLTTGRRRAPDARRETTWTPIAKQAA